MTLRSLVGLQAGATIDQFNQLPQIPDAQRLEFDTFLKQDYFNVNGRYATNKSYDEIHTYFYTQFSQMGWQYGTDRDVFVDGLVTDYCKGDYTASIYYGIGQYEISLTWGNWIHCYTVRGGARLLLALVQLLFPLGGSISWGIYAFIIGWAISTMDREEFEFAMGEIVKNPSVGKAKVESLGILFLSILIFLLSIYEMLSLNW